MFCEQLPEIVGYFDRLRDVDSVPAVADDGESPASPFVTEIAEAEDLPAPCLPAETLAGNAPRFVDGFVVVPRIEPDG